MISIIVPVYNAANYIEETIKTVVNQTYQDWELLLVDDCSRDGSTEVIRAAINHYEQEGVAKGRIRLILKQQNEGAAKARNTGIREAHGRYIAFLDADDLWYPDKLLKELAFMQQNEAAFEEFLKDYQASIEWVNSNTADAAELVANYGIVAKAPLAQKALPACNITYVDGAEMKTKLSGYLQVLFDQNPKAVGGAMPGDDFYYGA